MKVIGCIRFAKTLCFFLRRYQENMDTVLTPWQGWWLEQKVWINTPMTRFQNLWVWVQFEFNNFGFNQKSEKTSQPKTYWIKNTIVAPLATNKALRWVKPGVLQGKNCNDQLWRAQMFFFGCDFPLLLHHSNEVRTCWLLEHSFCNWSKWAPIRYSFFLFKFLLVWRCLNCMPWLQIMHWLPFAERGNTTVVPGKLPSGLQRQILVFSFFGIYIKFHWKRLRGKKKHLSIISGWWKQCEQ